MARVGVLLGTRDGERFLAEQLDSLASQTYSDWQLVASDDGSLDGTLAILNAFSVAWPGKVHVRAGPRSGFARNFLSMVENPGFTASFWAFCDQDDVWHTDKLMRAVAWLETVPSDRPALYCSRTTLVDAAGSRLGMSPDWRRTPEFRNALVQNVGSGNTMVFNEAARMLVARCSATSVPFHDWWLYLLVAGSDGLVRFDSLPSVSYRLHGDNALGPWGGWQSWRHRAWLVASGAYGAWLDANWAALDGNETELTAPARAALENFRAMRLARGLRRGFRFIRCRVFHQSRLAYLGLLLAAVLGRV